jgi:hypothetical protein
MSSESQQYEYKSPRAASRMYIVLLIGECRIEKSSEIFFGQLEYLFFSQRKHRFLSLESSSKHAFDAWRF